MAKPKLLPEVKEPLRVILTGNEAIALGAREAGVYFASAYPGTPSTEILETFARLPGVIAQWGVNEKTAFEAGIGASMAGARVLIAMKHVGVNVAMDPLMTFSYTGAVGGFVVVSADDPSMHSSQNEQDNRILARFAKIPLLEPSDAAEAHDFAVIAYEISEKFQTPVMLRTTTRVSHSKGIVTLNPWQEPKVKGFVRDIPRFVMVPQYARLRHTEVEKRLVKLREFSEETILNQVEEGEGDVGYITGGIAYAHLKEVLPDAPILKLGFTNPLPFEKIAQFASRYKRVIVVEELEPFYEEQIRAAGIPCEGKAYFPLEGELNPDLVVEGLIKAGILKDNGQVPRPEPRPLLPRPPVLCAGCPHRTVFTALKKLKADVLGDIGCYTLGALEPLEALHACICMGASVGMAAGISKVGGSSRPVVGVIGDSTFLHSGITALLDAVYNSSPLTLIILDNRATAMTGGQAHPGTGETLQGQPTFKVDYVQLCRALGVKHIFTTDAYDYEEVEGIIKKATGLNEPAVIITNRPCTLYPEKRKYESFVVDKELCNGCAACLRIGCPAIMKIAEKTEKGLHKVDIDRESCTGCSLCQQICPVNAISPESGGIPIVFSVCEVDSHPGTNPL